jgi:ribonuclease-3
MNPEREKSLRALELVLGHTFVDLALLDQALTHTSHANEEPNARHNEPFEFLGDAILGFVVADLLHRNDPSGAEGLKSRARAHLVSAPSLSRRADLLGLPPFLLLGRGEEKSGGREKVRLWADGLEAVVAALYLDGGLEVARRFIEKTFAKDVRSSLQSSRDPKSALQEILQGRGEPIPEYVVLAAEGPSHRRRFRVGCVVGGKTVSEAEGFSKKEAQQEAARRALQALGVSDDRSSLPPDTRPPRRTQPPGQE